MEIKDLIREKVLAEIIAERAGMILDMNQQIGALQKENEALKKEIEIMRAEIEKLTAPKEA